MLLIHLEYLQWVQHKVVVREILAELNFLNTSVAELSRTYFGVVFSTCKYK